MIIPSLEPNASLAKKCDENDKIVRNKARLVAKGYNQEEGLHFEETIAHVASLERIRMLLSFESFSHINLFQMDVKCTFLNSYLNEEVYVDQSPDFKN